MPIGYRATGEAIGPSIVPASLRLAYSPAAVAAQAANASASPTNEHYTLQPAQLAGGAVVTIATSPGDRIIVLERDGNQLSISFDGAAITAPNSANPQYQLLHPGLGELDRSWPTFRTVSIVASATPTNPVDVWVLGGAQALRPT